MPEYCHRSQTLSNSGHDLSTTTFLWCQFKIKLKKQGFLCQAEHAIQPSHVGLRLRCMLHRGIDGRTERAVSCSCLAWIQHQPNTYLIFISSRLQPVQVSLSGLEIVLKLRKEVAEHANIKNSLQPHCCHAGFTAFEDALILSPCSIKTRYHML